MSEAWSDFMVGLEAVVRLRLLPVLAFALACKHGPQESPRPHVRVVEINITDAELKDAAAAGLRKAGVEVTCGATAGGPGDFRLNLELRLENVAPAPDTRGK